MNDKTVEQEENIEDTAETETEGKATGTDQTKTAKSFTQEDVNKIVAREKAAWKRNHDKTVGEKESETETLRTEIEKRDEIIQQNVDLLRKDLNIPDEDWEFTSSGKTALEQYEFLLKKIEKVSKVDIQSTPRGKKLPQEFKSTFNPNM